MLTLLNTFVHRYPYNSPQTYADIQARMEPCDCMPTCAHKGQPSSTGLGSLTLLPRSKRARCRPVSKWYFQMSRQHLEMKGKKETMAPFSWAGATAAVASVGCPHVGSAHVLLWGLVNAPATSSRRVPAQRCPEGVFWVSGPLSGLWDSNDIVGQELSRSDLGIVSKTPL